MKKISNLLKTVIALALVVITFAVSSNVSYADDIPSESKSIKNLTIQSDDGGSITVNGTATGGISAVLVQIIDKSNANSTVAMMSGDVTKGSFSVNVGNNLVDGHTYYISVVDYDGSGARAEISEYIYINVETYAHLKLADDIVLSIEVVIPDSEYTLVINDEIINLSDCPVVKYDDVDVRQIDIPTIPREFANKNSIKIYSGEYTNIDDFKNAAVVYSKECSMKDYLEYVINKGISDDVDENTKEYKEYRMCKALYNYCSLASDVFGDSDTGFTLADADKVDSIFQLAECDYEIEVTSDSDCGFKYIGQSLILKDKIKIRLYFISDEKLNSGDINCEIYKSGAFSTNADCSIGNNGKLFWIEFELLDDYRYLVNDGNKYSVSVKKQGSDNWQLSLSDVSFISYCHELNKIKNQSTYYEKLYDMLSQAALYSWYLNSLMED